MVVVGEGRKGGVRLLEQWIDGTSVESTFSEQEGYDVTASGFAWHLYESCLKLLNNIIRLDGQTTNLETKPLKECLSRLFLWGEGFGGGQLDTVIQRSDALKSTILQFIAAIAKILLDGILDVAKELRPFIEKVESITIDELDDSDEDYNDDESDAASIISSTGGNAAKNINSYVSCLMGLLPSMEHTLNVHEDQGTNSSPVQFHVSNAALTYVHHVADKYKHADTILVSRLGEANLQRHIAIREKMAQKDAVVEEQLIVETISQVPKSAFIPTSIFQDSGFGSMPAASNLAPTIASHSSFKTDGSQGSKGSFRVPEAPVDAYEGVPFPCSICGHVLKNIKNPYDWKVHVFADLQPYICTFSECVESLRTFPTRKLWQEHEFSQHRVDITWTCPVCREESLNPDDWKEHVESNHRNSLSDVEARYAFAAAKRTRAQPIELQRCPLCLTVPGKTQRAFTTHVCKHLESIALAALPNEASSDSEAESVSSHQSLSSANNDEEVQEKGWCKECGKVFRDPKAHALTHQSERPDKCPVVTCEYHIKGFARKYDKIRHALTHYKGTMVCGFCPGSGTSAEKVFNRTDVFKRHLTSVHAVEQIPPNSRKDRPRFGIIGVKPLGYAPDATGKCTTCDQVFSNAQDFYEHLDDCVLGLLVRCQNEPSEAINAARLAEVENDPDLQDTLRRNMVPPSVLDPDDEILGVELAKYVTQEGEYMFRCQLPECKKLFKEEYSWKRHVETRHSEWSEKLKLSLHGHEVKQSFGVTEKNDLEREFESRNSNMGMVDFILTPVIFLTVILEAATHADYEGNGVTKVPGPRAALDANSSDFDVNGNDLCGGTILTSADFKRITSNR
ncbi:hypothetical protein LSUE1_G007787 [Lachnellula suecica]|uniref:C2H2-type domain-containing protein n=1 Tax=Lachnellula suecica TaxID=602035 RepID=A0A8T9C3U1_9HELO|nr:hypothetical protein LSUE1_G007787 [Lachnellula suecica]